MEIIKNALSPLLVEQCYRLSLGDLGKRLLYPVGSNRKYDVYDDMSALDGKQGTVFLLKRYGLRALAVSYRVILSGKLRVDVSYSYRPLRSSSQSIYLETEEAPYGTRYYMLCGCGRRCNVLYMRMDKPYYFACRACLNLIYELTRINRSVAGGELFYRFNRHIKLDNMSVDVKRIDYRGKYTKKAARVLRLSKRMAVPV